MSRGMQHALLRLEMHTKFWSEDWNISRMYVIP